MTTDPVESQMEFDFALADGNTSRPPTSPATQLIADLRSVIAGQAIIPPGDVADYFTEDFLTTVEFRQEHLRPPIDESSTPDEFPRQQLMEAEIAIRPAPTGDTPSASPVETNAQPDQDGNLSKPVAAGPTEKLLDKSVDSVVSTAAFRHTTEIDGDIAAFLPQPKSSHQSIPDQRFEWPSTTEDNGDSTVISADKIVAANSEPITSTTGNVQRPPNEDPIVEQQRGSTKAQLARVDSAGSTVLRPPPGSSTPSASRGRTYIFLALVALAVAVSAASVGLWITYFRPKPTFVTQANVEYESPGLVVLPARIEAENYDEGPPGEAYSDSGSRNVWMTYRDDGVDIAALETDMSRLVVTETANGEWLNYTVIVGQSARFNVTAGVVQTSDETRSIDLSMNGKQIASAQGPARSDPVVPTIIDLGEVDLDSGIDQVLQVEWSGGGLALDWIEFEIVELVDE